MTPFTDEDLKRLKKLNENQTAWGDSEMGWALDCLIAILARLEAAEKALVLAGNGNFFHGEYLEALEAWLRSCGKEVKS